MIIAHYVLEYKLIYKQTLFIIIAWDALHPETEHDDGHPLVAVFDDPVAS